MSQEMEKRKIGLLAGNGQFPKIIARTAAQRGYRVYAVAFNGEADPEMEELAEKTEWMHPGQLKKMLKFFHANGVTQAVMAGGIKKTRLFRDIKPDTKALAFIAGLATTHDDGALRAFARLMEKEGVEILASTFLLPELLAEEGCWTRKKPSRDQKSDMAMGLRLAREIGRLDIGQTVVVGSGSVLAVEAVEGTDAAIRRGGSLAGDDGAMVVKVFKPGQDMRFDVPAIGVQTIRTMIEAKVGMLVIEAGGAVVFDRDEMVALADRHGLVIVAEKRE